MEEEDEVLVPFIANQQPAPLSSEFDSFSPSSNGKSTKLPQKPAARRASNSPMWNKPDVDWSRTRGTSTSFSFGGLFGGGSKSTYEPIAPMDPNTAFSSPYSDEKNHIELDMDEDLRVGDSNEKLRRRRSTNAISSFVSYALALFIASDRSIWDSRAQFEQFSNTPRHNFKIQRSRRAAERIGIVSIVTALFVFFVVKHGHGKSGGFVETAKIKALGRPNVRPSFLSLRCSDGTALIPC